MDFNGSTRCLLVVLSLLTVSRGTLFELSCSAEQLGRAAQPAFELSKRKDYRWGPGGPQLFRQ